MDRSPHIPADRQVVQAYQAGGFKVSGTVFEGSIIVLPEEVRPWSVQTPGDLAAELFAGLRESGVDILVVGLGPDFLPFPAELRRTLREWGMVVEAMATPAACRTYNVLLAEDRRVAAALIAMPGARTAG
ncbi:Mth938-like domain-containing protein [Geminicoccaceae bacterium 1502E]|nr:Mth938-like domain-containing protein [Geminicoccaceae bacterium 1502E]